MLTSSFCCKADGNKHIIKHYLDNGKIQSDYYLNKAGQKIGKFKEFYPEGKLQMTCNYIDGKIEGPVTELYESGQLKAVGYFKNGQRDSVGKFFYPNGVLKAENYYYKGKAFGLQKEFDEGSSLKSLFFMTDDSCMVSSIDLAKDGSIINKHGNLTYCIYDKNLINPGDSLVSIFYTYAPPKYRISATLIEKYPSGSMRRENVQLEDIEHSKGYILSKRYYTPGHYKVGISVSLHNDFSFTNYSDSTFLDFQVR